MNPGDNDGIFCRWLWSQVLQLAIEDVQGRLERRDYTSGVRVALKRDARHWIGSDSTHTGSFLWVCAQLDLDPGRVRAAVAAGTHAPRKRNTRIHGGYALDPGLGYAHAPDQGPRRRRYDPHRGAGAGMTVSQRRCLDQARRWAGQVPRARSAPDKRRAARKVLDCLLVFLAGRAPTEMERRSP